MQQIKANVDCAVKQLAAYMHQVLIEQLDRRFVLGFVLLFDELTLVLFDRSGVTMTKKAINIHKKPKIFIRIMTGLSSMSPAQLGWDTSMEIYRPISNDIKPSYTIADKFEGVYGKGRYNIHWLIDVEQGDEVEKYVAVSMISAIRSAEICGRATVVYEVVKFDEKDDPKETYALKRYWRPIRSGNSDLYPSEGKIYEIIDEGQEDDTLKHAIVYHDIKVDDQVDSTFELIRRGMVAERYERPVKPLPASRAETDADAELRADRRDVPEDSPTPTADPSILTPLDRHHMNILMPMGLEIKLFCHLLELLTCFRDFLREEKHGNDKLVLHRDVSAGNVLIFQGKDGSSCGRLMDYDHAKKAENYDLFGTRNLSPSQLETERGLTRPLVEYALKRKVENDILDVALKWFDSVDAIGYIRTAAQFTGLVGENASQKPICATDLGWGPVNKTYKWPDFANREAGPGERTVLGTSPEEFRIERCITGDSLADMPQLDPNPPDFKPTGRYTAECKEIIDLAHGDGFLWPEEMKAVHHLMMLQNEAFAWDDSQRGRLKEEFFPPVVMPVIPHTPWVLKNIPIAPGPRDKICQMIKKKIEAGVYEPSELYGLVRALQANKYWLVGCRKLVVEPDAKYLKGMLSNPGVGPNATIMRWIEDVLLYHFTLRHVPGKTFSVDGLSRRLKQPGDEEYPPVNPELMDNPKAMHFEYPAKTNNEPIEEFADQIDTRGGYLHTVATEVSDFEQELDRARQALFKACEDHTKWFWFFFHVMWSDHITIQQASSFSFHGPMVVIAKTRGGNYIVAELDGSVWQTKVAAFRVVPYRAQRQLELSQSLEQWGDITPEKLKELRKGLQRPTGNAMSDLSFGSIRLHEPLDHDMNRSDSSPKVDKKLESFV
ncbi:hypothetical protein J132_05191 [Termitomyces sp. J132]|nr:hypothetical protein J132_05191 [Termitomyces sp. J132]